MRGSPWLGRGEELLTSCCQMRPCSLDEVGHAARHLVAVAVTAAEALETRVLLVVWDAQVIEHMLDVHLLPSASVVRVLGGYDPVRGRPKDERVDEEISELDENLQTDFAMEVCKVEVGVGALQQRAAKPKAQSDVVEMTANSFDHLVRGRVDTQWPVTVVVLPDRSNAF